MLMSRDPAVLNRGINVITRHEGMMENLRALGGGGILANIHSRLISQNPTDISPARYPPDQT